jgi:hypothetical protein
MKTQITREILPKIKAPKWKVANRYILNEYELRCLQVEVGKGNIQSGISVVEMGTKEKAFILEDGSMSNRLGEGLRIAAKFAIESMEIKCRKNPIKKIN